MEIDLKHAELQQKIGTQFGTGPYLGSYNPTQRREAIFAKLKEYFEEYKESKEDKVDPNITDPVERKVMGILKKVEKLKTGVEKFEGPHFNLEFLKLNEKCTNYQIELNFCCKDKALDGNRRMALRELNEISERLCGKIHKGEKCDMCS